MSQMYMTQINQDHKQPNPNHNNSTNPQPTPFPLITQNVSQAYQKLHNNIDQMHAKIQHIISKQQAQFVIAYRSHIVKIKKQLQEISKKSQQQEKMFSANDRIKFLEKQVAVFREEAIQVYGKLQKVMGQLDVYKHKYQEIVKMYHLSQKSVKQSMRQTKIMFSTQQNYSQTIKNLQKKIIEKDKQIQQLKQRAQNQQIKNHRLLGSIDSQRTYKNSRYDNKLDSSGVQSLKKSIIIGQSSQIQANLYKDIFFQCVRAVKKQIVKRKHQQKLDLKNIQNLNDFREIDKIQVLDMFFSNKNVEAWVYEKLFPNTLFNKLQNYSNSQTSPNTNAHTNQPIKNTMMSFVLPKMRQTYRKHASKLQYTNKSFM